jgi:hypothetical protein
MYRPHDCVTGNFFIKSPTPGLSQLCKLNHPIFLHIINVYFNFDDFIISYNILNFFKCPEMKMLQTFLLFFSFTITEINSQSPINYVYPLIGTAPTKAASALRHSDPGSEESGQTSPAVGCPFGMTQWTSETRATEFKCIAPYYYNDKYITGFRGSHWMSGGCTQDYGSATLMPFTTNLPDTLAHIPSYCSHDRRSCQYNDS